MRTTIRSQDPKTPSPEVIVILDDDENEEITNLLHDGKQDKKCRTTAVQLEQESGMMLEKQSEEDHWRTLLQKATGRNAAAKKILMKKRHEAGIASTALMIPLPPAERAVAREAVTSLGDDTTIIQNATGPPSMIRFIQLVTLLLLTNTPK